MTDSQRRVLPAEGLGWRASPFPLCLQGQEKGEGSPLLLQGAVHGTQWALSHHTHPSPEPPGRESEIIKVTCKPHGC